MIRLLAGSLAWRTMKTLLSMHATKCISVDYIIVKNGDNSKHVGLQAYVTPSVKKA